MELKQLLSFCADEPLVLVKVKLDKKNKTLIPVISCSCPADERTKQQVVSVLEEAMPGFSVEPLFLLSPPDQEDEEKTVELVLQAWQETAPAVRPFLKNAKGYVRDGVVTILVPESMHVQLFGTRALSKVRDTLKNQYHFCGEIEVIPSKEIECSVEGVEQTQEEKVLPFELRAPKKIEKKDKPNASPCPASSDVIYGKQIKKVDVMSMDKVKEDSGRVMICGWPFCIEEKPTRDGANCILTFNVTDYNNSLPVKLFLATQEAQKVSQKLSEISNAKDDVLIRGDAYLDKYTHELTIEPFDMNRVKHEKRMDTCPHKRVELHLHTQLSSMDGITKVKDAIQTAAAWGHKAIAITDHGVVQAFPEAAKVAKKAGVKLLFGLEGYLIQDSEPTPILEVDPVAAVLDVREDRFHQQYLLRICLARRSGEQTTICVDPGPDWQGERFQNELPLFEALEAYREFTKGSPVLLYDREGFSPLLDKIRSREEEDVFEYIDAMTLSHYLLPKQKDLSFGAVLEHYGIQAEEGASVEDTAKALLMMYDALVLDIKAHGSTRVPVFQDYGKKEKVRGHNARHIILIASTQKGLYNLYHLVSIAHLEYFKGVPRIPKSVLDIYREGIILGSACEAGELFRAILHNEPMDRIRRIADWYDYLEVQPLGNNAFLMREGLAANEEQLKDFNRKIVELGEILNKPVVATGDVHFLNPEDARYRKILMFSKGFADAEDQAPLYFKTTEEMLQEFSYLGEEKALEVVVTAPNAIADLCEELKPYPDGTHAPVIEGAEETLKRMSYDKAKEIYGDPYPPVVAARLEKEINSITTHGFASLYMMAQKLVSKSLSDGYLVGSRGSVGSSFVAFLLGITEVNPLEAHYVCPDCKHSDFETKHPLSHCGVDLPDANCPKCGAKYQKMGFDIPFEVFLGFHGDKTPDIDLNFSGDYQPVAHRYTEEMFGEGHAFRAGTIAAVQEKTVYGYLKKYMEEKDVVINRAEMDCLAMGCSGVKRTTGQHPGGIVVVPSDRDILEFTPIQYPADQKEKNTITTHFDFHALDDRLVKLDILGHDDPTVLRMLYDYTGLDPKTIPLDDPDTMKLYSDVSPLGISLEEIGSDVGALGLPEFGTHFVRGMLKETRPTTMEELVRISGLSHGTDVWLNNAQDLVRDGIATLSEAICTRDDIMTYLIGCGMESSWAFKIMESVRKGKGLSEDMERLMRENSVPEWYIDSCKKIKYMFPRAHASAYVIMSFRIAYYKVHYPKAYYAVYFTVRADAFDIFKASGGAKQVLKNIREIEKLGNKASSLEKDLMIILELVYEMNLRGIEFLPVDLYKSDSHKFLIEGDCIRPPLRSIPGVGDSAAVSIANEAKKGTFLSVEDFVSRTKSHTGIVQALTLAGCLEGLPKSNQLSLF